MRNGTHHTQTQSQGIVGLGVAAFGRAGVPSGCEPGTESGPSGQSPRSSTVVSEVGSSGVQLPTYAPVDVVKPDLPDPGNGAPTAFLAYPSAGSDSRPGHDDGRAKPVG